MFYHNVSGLYSRLSILPVNLTLGPGSKPLWTFSLARSLCIKCEQNTRLSTCAPTLAAYINLHMAQGSEVVKKAGS